MVSVRGPDHVTAGGVGQAGTEPYQPVAEADRALQRRTARRAPGRSRRGSCDRAVAGPMTRRPGNVARRWAISSLIVVATRSARMSPDTANCRTTTVRVDVLALHRGRRLRGRRPDEARDVGTRGQLDAESIRPALVCVVLLQGLADPTGTDPHGGVEPAVEGVRPPQRPAAHGPLGQPLSPAGQGLGDDVGQEVAGARRLAHRGAAQHLRELADDLRGVVRAAAASRDRLATRSSCTRRPRDVGWMTRRLPTRDRTRETVASEARPVNASR